MRQIDTDKHVQDALRAVYERHYLSLVRFSLLLVGTRELAEDIVQEAFVRFAPRATELEAEAAAPYLRKTIVNLWKNRRRRLGFELKARARLASLPESESGDRPEERDEVWQAITRLADRQKACIVLRYYEDLPEPQIAQVLNCSVGTVKSHLSRALARLRKELTNEA